MGLATWPIQEHPSDAETYEGRWHRIDFNGLHHRLPPPNSGITCTARHRFYLSYGCLAKRRFGLSGNVLDGFSGLRDGMVCDFSSRFFRFANGVVSHIVSGIFGLLRENLGVQPILYRVDRAAHLGARELNVLACHGCTLFKFFVGIRSAAARPQVIWSFAH
jgi:hypothetical protein